ncbi:MAG: DNA polymerase III subunit delta [Eubacterium sp.]|jgi:DNA polymerase-3 subunit delta
MRGNNRNDYEIFLNDKKAGRIPSVAVFCGRERFLTNWAAGVVKSSFVARGAEAIDFSRIVVPELIDVSLFDAVKAACETPPMISEKRVVEVADLKAFESNEPIGLSSAGLEELAAYLPSVPDYTLLVFTYGEPDFTKKFTKAAASAGKIYYFGKLNRGDLAKFAAKRLKAENASITVTGMERLLNETGYYGDESDYDLAAFDNDLKKLAALCAGRMVDDKDISDSILGADDTYVFTMLDQISAGRKDLALKSLYNVMDGTNTFNLIGLIISQFEIMLSVHQMRADGITRATISRDMKVNRYRIDKICRYAESFSTEKIKNALLSAYELDESIKTGLLSERLALEMFVAGI